MVVPLADLVTQWVDRARQFGFKPLRWDSSASAAERRTVLDAFRRTQRGRSGAYASMVVTTADSLTGGLKDVVSRHDGSLLIVGDEMHSLGTATRLAALPQQPTFTLGLSATPKRHLDDVGTDELLRYFGDPVLSISIKEAIEIYKALVPYRYHVDFVNLTDDEATEFKRLSKLIAGAIGGNRDPDSYIRARSNVVSHAEEKFAALSHLLADAPWRYEQAKHLLVYVGEGAAAGAQVGSIARAADLLGNVHGMRVSTYTAQTPSDERVRLQSGLATGELQALLAMRCLDEGVDIPEARIGIMMASTQNPRQFVQRRGRILRRAHGKTVADIHDMLVVPRSMLDLADSDRTLLGAELSRAYELADAADNRNTAIQVVREAAIAAGLVDPKYPWMAELDAGVWFEWTSKEGELND